MGICDMEARVRGLAGQNKDMDRWMDIKQSGQSRADKAPQSIIYDTFSLGRCPIRKRHRRRQKERGERRKPAATICMPE